MPYGGFSPVRLQGRPIRRGLPARRPRVAPHGLRPPFVPTACKPRISGLCRRRCAHEHRRSSGYAALPQGPSLRSGLCCPGPSSLSRPHPPHSQAHHDFAALRFIRDAFAVLLPRRPTSGSVLSLLVPSRHAVLSDPGELVGDLRPIAPPTTLAFASSGQARRSQLAPTIRFKWVPQFRGFTGSRICYGLSIC